MEFGEKEFLELLRLLDRKPELLQMLRQKILTDELLHLPEQVQELVGLVNRLYEVVQEHTEQLRHHARLFEEILETLRELREIAQEHTRQLQEHTRQLEEHTRQFEKVWQSIHELRETVERYHQMNRRDIEEIKQDQKKMQDTLAMLKGFYLEEQFRRRAPAYFARLMRRLQVFSPEQLAQMADDAVDAGLITMEERNDLLDADLVARGQVDGEERYLVVEISSVVDSSDVNRVLRRAEVLNKISNQMVHSVVAGERILKKALQQAHQRGIVWVQGSPRTR